MVIVGVIGAGHWGPNLVRNLNNGLSSRVAWVIDRDESRLREIRLRFPDIQVSTSVPVVLADDTINAVVIATPSSTHYALTKASLEAGKHVLVEKPLATSVDHAAELRDIAAHRGLVLLVGHVFLYNEAVRWIRRYLDSGELGDVYYIATVRTNLGPIRHDVNAAWDLAAHDISITSYWLASEPEWVSARSGCWINAGVADVLFATLGYPNQVLANLHVSWLNPRKSREVTVAGSKKMLTFDDMNLTEPVRLYDQQVTDTRTTVDYVDTFASFRASIRTGDITIPRVSSGEPLRLECEHFIDCITRLEAPLTNAQVGLSVVRVLEAIERSCRRGGSAEAVSRE
jgi:predicted dehydrogenase